jgi:hypothetical protein
MRWHALREAGVSRIGGSAFLPNSSSASVSSSGSSEPGVRNDSHERLAEDRWSAPRRAQPCSRIPAQDQPAAQGVGWGQLLAEDDRADHDHRDQFALAMIA